jgi:hypothetical protein
VREEGKTRRKQDIDSRKRKERKRKMTRPEYNPNIGE